MIFSGTAPQATIRPTLKIILRGKLNTLMFMERLAGRSCKHFLSADSVLLQVQTMYSQVYWTRNNPIDLPPELVTSIGRKLINFSPVKIYVKRNRSDLKYLREEIFSEMIYFQKTNIFREETF